MVQRARPSGGLEHAVATSSACSWPVSLRLAPGRGSSWTAFSRLPSTKAALGPVDGRAAHAECLGHGLVRQRGSFPDTTCLARMDRNAPSCIRLHKGTLPTAGP